MGDLFLSHSSRDKVVAATLQAELEADGHRVFLDSDHEDGIAPGAEWMQALFTELRLCHAVVFLNSAHSQGSKWCHTELAIAMQMGKEVFALHVDPSPPLAPHPLLDHLQAIPVAESQRVRTELTRTRADDARGVRWDRDRSPYPGLAAFEPGDAGVFFGRDEDRARLVARVDPPLGDRDGRLIVVMGPSGCGKSSLVRAGLLPRIRTNPRWLALEPFEPGVTPMDRLVSRLVTASATLFDASRCRRELESYGLAHVAERLIDAMPVAAGHLRPQRLLVTVDQAEQLLVETTVDRTAFATLLGNGLGAGSPVTVVATLRSDRLDGFQGLPGLGEGMSEPLALAPLRRTDLAAVIEGPAARAGLSFEPGLVAELIDDATRDSADSSVVGAMPLLAFTLRELADRAVSSDRAVITIQDYRDLGGIAGAISRRATETEQSLPPTAGAALDAVLLRLVTLREDRPPGARPLPRADLDAAETDVVRRLEDQRLLSGAGDEVRLVHEQLVASWPRLQRLIADRRADLLLQSRLERQAADWKTGSGDVLNSAAAADASGWLTRVDEAVPTDDVRTFIAASRLVHRRRRRRAFGAVAAVAAFAVAAAGAAVVAVGQRRTADAAADRARSGELVALARSTSVNEPVIGALVAVDALYPNGRTEPFDSADARNEVGVALRAVQNNPMVRIGPRIAVSVSDIVSFDSRSIRTINTQGPHDAPADSVLVPQRFDVVTGALITERLTEEELLTLYRPYEYLPKSVGASVGLARSPSLAGPGFRGVVTFDAPRAQYVGVDLITGDVVARPVSGTGTKPHLDVPDGVTLDQIVVTGNGLVVGRAKTDLGAHGDGIPRSIDPADDSALSADASHEVEGWFVWDLAGGGAPVRLTSAGPDDSDAYDQDVFGPVLGPDVVPARLVSVGTAQVIAVYDGRYDDPTIDPVPVIELVELSASGVVSRRRLQRVFPGERWAVSASGRYVASISSSGLSSTVEVWNLDSGVLVETIPSNNATDIRWSDASGTKDASGASGAGGGDVLAIGSSRNVEFWRVNSDRIRFASVEGLEVSAGRIAVMSHDPIDDPRAVQVAVMPEARPATALSKDDRHLAVNRNGSVEVQDVATGQRVATIVAPTARDVAFDPTGRYLAVGGSGALALVATATWAIDRTVVLGAGEVTRLSWSGDGSIVAVEQSDPVNPGVVISLVTPATNGVSDVTHGARVLGPVALNHHGTLLAYGSVNGTVEFRHVRDGVAAPSGPRILELDQTTSLAFSPDGDRLVIASRGDTQMHSVSTLAALAASSQVEKRVTETPTRIGSLTAVPGVSEFVAFRPDGRSLVLGGIIGYLELADFDPALACSLATPADLEAARRLVGATLACERVASLRGAPRSG